MATVLALYTSAGCVGRCDAHCHNAGGDVCRCICGGVNHGVGAEQAAENAAQMGIALAQVNQDRSVEPAMMQLPLPLTI